MLNKGVGYQQPLQGTDCLEWKIARLVSAIIVAAENKFKCSKSAERISQSSPLLSRQGWTRTDLAVR